MTSPFNFNNVKDFDDHIRRSIPSYEFLSKQIVEYIDCFSSGGTSVIDLGCSTGRLLKSLPKKEGVSYYGVDSSDLFIEGSGVTYIKSNVLDFDKKCTGPASVISCVFLMQFLQEHERKILLNKISDFLISGGCFICCEKTHFDNPVLENITQTLHLSEKATQFSLEEVMKKQMELSRTMWLKTNRSLIDELSYIGTPHIFWKSYGFTGVILFKDKHS